MLQARISAPCALSASLREAAAVRRPATRERLGEVVVGGGLDVDEGGLLSVDAAVAAGDYATAANKPTLNGEPIQGDVRITTATVADIINLFE